MRQKEIAWCRTVKGDTDPSTLSSINQLAIDLCETKQLEEAEMLLRELVESYNQILEADDFQIGGALTDLAKTLERVDKIEEATAFAQQAFDHRLEHEGPDAWSTNNGRLDLARLLHKSEQNDQSLLLLFELITSMEKLTEPDEEDQSLIAEAEQLIQSTSSGTGCLNVE